MYKYDPAKSRLNKFLSLHGIDTEKAISCLWHNDTNPSLTPIKDRDGIVYNYHCFGCNKTADIYDFASYFYGLDIKYDFPKIKERVYDELGLQLSSRKDNPYKPVASKTPVFINASKLEAVYNNGALQNLGNYTFKTSEAKVEKIYPYKSKEGEIMYVECRYEGYSMPNGKKQVLSVWFDGLSLHSKGCPVSLYNQDKLVFSETSDFPVVIHEGAKCAQIASEQLPFFVHTAYNGGGKKYKTVDFSLLKGREVYIYPDDDQDLKVGINTAKEIQRKLKEDLGIEAIIVKPVPQARSIKSSGADIVEALQVMKPDKLSEWITTEHYEAEVVKDKGRPCFLLNNGYELQNIVPEVVNALEVYFESKGGAGLYTRNGLILSIENGNIVIVNKDHLRYIIAQVCTFKSGSKTLSPPIDIVASIYAHPSEFFRSIDRIITYPVITRSGRAITSKGYDEETKCYYDIPENIEQELKKIKNVNEARFVLEDMFRDFCFACASDKAHIIALMLTHIMRDKIDCLVPGFVTTAPIQGSGKTLLNRVAFMTLLGKEPSVTLMGRDDIELQKHIGAEILTGKPYFFIDNISRKIRSEIITAMLTSGTVGFRILGKSEICYAENNFVFALTANNPEIDKDLLRRLVFINLDTNKFNPAEIDLKKFEHPDILRYVKDNRARILASLLYIAEQTYGRYSGHVMGSFERWSISVGNVLEAAGIEGFLSNIQTTREQQVDEREEAVNVFVEKWGEKFGEGQVYIEDLVELTEGTEMIPEQVKQKKISLGKIINGIKNKIINNRWKVIKCQSVHNKSVWALKEVKLEE